VGASSNHDARYLAVCDLNRLALIIAAGAVVFEFLTN
jgi:hypothetical protein